MVEKTKLSRWDFFVSALSGHVIVMSVIGHCLCKGVLTWKAIFDSSSALLAVAGLLTIVVGGLLFEPIANYVTKLLTTYPSKYSKVFGFKTWDADIVSLEKKAGEYVPKGIKGSAYQYCKNWLRQNGSDDSHVPFLVKYGFYRSMFVLVLLNGLTILFLYQWSCFYKTVISVSTVGLAAVYLQRSRVFYRHMAITVYSQFISAFNTEETTQ